MVVIVLISLSMLNLRAMLAWVGAVLVSPSVVSLLGSNKIERVKRMRSGQERVGGRKHQQFIYEIRDNIAEQEDTL